MKEDTRDGPAARDPAALVACHECDLLQRRIDLTTDGKALCARCGAKLYGRMENSLERALALMLAAAVLFVIGNAFPVVTMELQGQHTVARAWEGAWQLHQDGSSMVGAMVFLTACVFPALQIAGLLAVLVPLRFDYAPGYLVPLLRVIAHSRPWSMVEVFMLGVLVSLVKLAHMATVVPGVGMWAIFGLIVVLAWATATLDEDEIWRRIEARGTRTAPAADRVAPAA